MRTFFAALAALLLTLAQASAQPATGRFWGTPAGPGEAASGAVGMGVGADALAYPCGHPSVVYGCGIVRRTAPTGGNVALGTTAAAAIPAASVATAARVEYQVQGTGYACLSWVTTAVTITGTTGNATCGGAGAYLVTAGSRETREGAALPTTALTAVAASGATLQIAWSVQ